MAQIFDGKGLGWLADYPDVRDHTVDAGTVSSRRAASGPNEDRPVGLLLKEIGISEPSEKVPASVDLREWCSPIEDQGQLGSCTAQAGVGLVEYFERKAFGRHLDSSRLFVYKATRNLMQETGDTGAYLRTTMGALAIFGAPPEEYYPYEISRFDEEPPAFCYSFGQAYQAIDYYRLDPVGTSTQELLQRIKTNLAASLPSMFGFTVYSSIRDADDGDIPYPGGGETVIGGHAVVAVGYDDKKSIKNSGEGALLIRNSWGKSWGDKGYGWLPYQYVTNGLAVDWWSILKTEWVETTEFRV